MFTNINSIYNKLLKFDDDEIEFKKSSNTILSNYQIAKKNCLYDFDYCKYGDKVYIDKDFGYNLVVGEYIGFCCVEKGLLDDKPRFVYKEDIGKMNWLDAIENSKEIPNGYLPNKDELKTAYFNGLEKELVKNKSYWSSTLYDSDYAYIIITTNGYVSYYSKVNDDLVRPFFHISPIENQVNESFDFNKTLLLFDDEIEFKKTTTKLTKKNVANLIDYIKFVDEDFVDLGLPSGTLWCKHNLGATCGDTPESWYGNYFAWGELETKEKYSGENYTYKDNPSILPLSNDVVYQTYSKIFQYQNIPVMPTHEQIRELDENTNSKWVKNYNGIDGLNGRIFTSKVNSNSLFIPAAGYRYGSNLGDVGNDCRLWSSSLRPSYPDCAWRLSFNSDYINSNGASDRYYGLSVRGVL